MIFALPIRLTACGVAFCISGATGSAFSATCNNGTCMAQYRCLLNKCNDQFNNDDPAHDDYKDEYAWQNCREGARAHRAACLSGTNWQVLEVFWAAFIQDLKDCIKDFGEDGDNPNPENLFDCFEESLQNYRDQLENNAPDPDPDACAGQAVPRGLYGSMFIGRMETLRSAAVQQGNPDGWFSVTANSTVSVSAGEGVHGGVAYDAAQIACVKSAMAIAVYRTKDGTAVVPMDADLNTADGTTFDVMFFGSALVGTDEVMLLTIFFDEQDKPVFGEYGWFRVEQSPFSGEIGRAHV